MTERPITILTIDDEPSIRQSFRFYLEDLGYRVLEAEDGAVGLELIAEDRPDVVLVDLRMPEVDGLEVLASVQANEPDLPVIVVSGTGVITDAIEALRLGAWDYLIKPIPDLQVLEHAINMALERSRLRRENASYQQHLEQLVEDRTEELRRTNDDLQKVNERLHRIVESTRSLAACSQVAQFGAQLLKEFARQMVAGGGSLFLVEETGLRLVHALDPGHAPEFIPFPLEPNSILQKLLTEAEPVLLKDEDDWIGLTGTRWPGYGNSSVLAFPIQTKEGDVIGLLSLHTKQDFPFTEQDKDIGVILSSYSCEVLRSTRATELLARSEARHRELVESMVVGVVLCDEDYHICYANPMASRILELEPEEMIDTGFTAFIESTHRDEATGLLGQATTSSSTEVEVPLILGNGGYKLIRMAAIRQEPAPGETPQVLITFQDITELRQLEEQLQQAQKMDALGILAGGIAHDFNNILFAILGNANLAQSDTPPDSPVRTYLEEIIQSGQRASELVKQILSFARQTDIHREPLILGPIIKESLKLMRSTLPANIEILQRLHTPNARVIGDATQLHQVLMNLCTNANHAMLESGGQLLVELQEAEICDDLPGARGQITPGEYAVLSVSDSGTGIEPHLLTRIFEPFFTTKDTASGTGMGLSVVHGIVNQMGGTILVESRPGRGSTFRVYLPLAGEAGGARTRGRDEDVQGGTERILLVDDEPALSTMLTKLLGNLGYRVTALTSSPQALEAFRLAPDEFDLVLTDQAMPALTGAQLASEMIQIRPGIPVILCTGYSEVLKPEEARRIGIREYLYKPVNTRELAKIIRRALDEPPEPVSTG